MREIKFRAWHKDEGMINVSRLDIADGILYKYLTTGKAYDYWNDVKLMQCTGMKDMNGIEIYEGDIVEMFHGTHTSEVRWNLQYGCWEIEVPFTEHELLWDLLGNHIDKVEVVGNVYEDIELDALREGLKEGLQGGLLSAT